MVILANLIDKLIKKEECTYIVVDAFKRHDRNLDMITLLIILLQCVLLNLLCITIFYHNY